MKKNVMLVIGLIAIMLSTGCNEIVLPGHVGRTWEPGGFNGEVLAPGRHSCWGRCKMYQMESTDQTFKIPMSVLCADNLNFSFDIDVLVSVNLKNDEEVKAAFGNLKPAEEQLFTISQLFETYIRPVADQEARKVVSKYKTEELVQKRAVVIEEVRTAVTLATNTAILQVKRVTVGNLDFPDVITKAQERKAQMRVEIETARAEGQKTAARAQADLQLAKIRASKEMLEAQAISDANRIIAASISPQYLAYKQILAMEKAADGKNNMFLIPYTDVMNGSIDTSKWLKPEGIVDAELLKRINTAKEAAEAEIDNESAEKTEESPAEGVEPTPSQTE